MYNQRERTFTFVVTVRLRYFYSNGILDAGVPSNVVCSVCVSSCVISAFTLVIDQPLR